MRAGAFHRGVLWLTIGLLSLMSGAGRAWAEAAHSTEPAGAASHDAHAAAPGEPDYNLPPISPNREMAILFVFTLVLFGLFLFAGRAWVWQPLIRALDQRESRVNRAHAEAEAAQAQAQRLLDQHEARMAEVHEQVKEIVAQARKEAEAEKAQILASAEARAKEMRDRAIADIRQARDQALGQLDREIDRQAAIAVEHVVGHAIG